MIEDISHTRQVMIFWTSIVCDNGGFAPSNVTRACFCIFATVGKNIHIHMHIHTYIYTCIDLRKTKQDKKMKGERDGWVQRDGEEKERLKEEERGKGADTASRRRNTWRVTPSVDSVQLQTLLISWMGPFNPCALFTWREMNEWERKGQKIEVKK